MDVKVRELGHAGVVTRAITVPAPSPVMVAESGGGEAETPRWRRTRLRYFPEPSVLFVQQIPAQDGTLHMGIRSPPSNIYSSSALGTTSSLRIVKTSGSVTFGMLKMAC